MYNEKVQELMEYIKSSWAKCVRTNRENKGSLIGLLHPYIVSCKESIFQEIYYGDTYFTNFEHTGNLWEKYNVVEGSINVNNEYEMPPMMGWTAGVLICASQLLEQNKC